MNLNQYSLSAAQPGLAIDRIKRLLLPVPSFQEQKSIANYMDTQTAKIDRKIDLLAKKATKYSELKLSLIYETVTRGLAKTVPMKDSGVEWIGEMPENWEVKRLKDVFKTIKGKSLELKEEQFENHLPNLSLEFLRNDKVRYIEYSFSESPIYRASSNDLIIVWDGAGVGEILKAKEGFLSSTIAKLKFYDLSEKEYFYNIRFIVENKLKKIPTGMGIPHLNPTILYNFMIPAPPKIEREAIVDYLNKKTLTIDRIIKTINIEIEKLKELRKTLINDVVTGKIKVTREGE